MLSRIKLTFPEIRLAILRIDDTKLSLDELKAIARQLPTTDEVSKHLPVIPNSSFSNFGNRLPAFVKLKTLKGLPKQISTSLN